MTWIDRESRTIYFSTCRSAPNRGGRTAKREIPSQKIRGTALRAYTTSFRGVWRIIIIIVICLFSLFVPKHTFLFFWLYCYSTPKRAPPSRVRVQRRRRRRCRVVKRVRRGRARMPVRVPSRTSYIRIFYFARARCRGYTGSVRRNARRRRWCCRRWRIRLGARFRSAADDVARVCARVCVRACACACMRTSVAAEGRPEKRFPTAAGWHGTKSAGRHCAPHAPPRGHTHERTRPSSASPVARCYVYTSEQLLIYPARVRYHTRCAVCAR